MTVARLELREITKTYGRAAALRGVSLSVEDGELVAIVGPSGCGKSTLLSIVAGLDAPSSGEILIDGRAVNALSPRERDVAMVFQSYALYPHMTVRRNLAFPLEVARLGRREIDARVGEVAALLGIEPLLDRHPAALSGGQRQRVALARALSAEPRLLVLDDSLSSVDADTEKLILGHLREVMSGRTAVLISHRVAAIKDADQILVLDEGKLVEQGSHDQLIAKAGVYAELYRTQLEAQMEIKEAG